MNLATYATRNMFRRKGRTILTVIAVMLAVLIFALIRTVVTMWNAGADEALQDRLATRHKASITMTLPKTYFDQVKQAKDVRGDEAVWQMFFEKNQWIFALPTMAGCLSLARVGACGPTFVRCRCVSTRPVASTAIGRCRFANQPASPLRIWPTMC